MRFPKDDNIYLGDTHKINEPVNRNLVPCRDLFSERRIAPKSGCRAQFTCSYGPNEGQGHRSCIIRVTANQKRLSFCDTTKVGVIGLCDKDYKAISGTEVLKEDSDSTAKDSNPVMFKTSVGDTGKEMAVIQESRQSYKKALSPGTPVYNREDIKQIPCNILRSSRKFPKNDEVKARSVCKVELSCVESDEHQSTYPCIIPTGKMKLDLHHCGDASLLAADSPVKECDDKFLQIDRVQDTGTDTHTQEDCDGLETGASALYQDTHWPAETWALDSDSDCDGDVDMTDATGVDDPGPWGYLVHLGTRGDSESLATLDIDSLSSTTLLDGRRGLPHPIQWRFPTCSKLPAEAVSSYSSNFGCQAAISCWDGSQVTYTVCRLDVQTLSDIVEADQCGFTIKPLDWCQFDRGTLKEIGF